MPAHALGLAAPVLLLLLVFLPLALYFGGFFRHPLEILGKVLATRTEAARLAVVFGRSAWIAALAATLALGGGVAVLTAALWLPVRAGRSLLALAAVPFFIPVTVSAIAWIQAFGQAGWITHLLGAAGLPQAWLPAILYSTSGCAMVLALHDFPIVLALGWLGWRGTGRAALEAGATLMTPGRLWRGLLAGWLQPWFAAGWLLVFMRALHEYSAAMLLRQHVFSVEIVSAFNVYYDPTQAMALALPLVLLGLLGAALLARILAGVRWPAEARQGARLPTPAPLLRRSVIAIASLVTLPALLVPLITLIFMAGGWRAYQMILASARDQIQSSLVNATGASLVAGALAALLAAKGLWTPAPRSLAIPNPQSAIRSPQSAFRILLAALIFALIGLPGSVIGIALIEFWNRSGLAGLPSRIYDSGLVLPLGLAILTLPFAWIILRGRLRETPRVLIEQQHLQPLAPWRRWWALTFPRLARPALMAAGLGFVLAMHEAQAALLLASPGQETMSIRAMTLLHNAPDSLVAAFCLILIGMVAAGLGLLCGTGWAIQKLNRGWLQ